MNPRFAVTQHAAESRKNRAATPIVVRAVVPLDEAANDATSIPAFRIFGDPLFGMAIASGILFAILAALIAFS